MGRKYLLMRKELTELPPAPNFPLGTQSVLFSPELHARAAWALLEEAYESGGGSVTAFEDWWPKVANDPEYDPATIFTALDTTGRLIGVVMCWSVPFVKDAAVVPDWRNKGLGEALLQQAFVAFYRRGERYIDLKVHDNNPARRLYMRLGMRVV